MRMRVILLLTWIVCCCSGDRYDPRSSLDAEAQEQLTRQMVRYMYSNEGIPEGERFDAKFDVKYERVLPDYALVQYFTSTDQFSVFLISRRYGNGKFRATGGRLKLNDEGVITAFEEMFVTPLLDVETAKKRGAFLFDQLVKNGRLDEKHLEMKSFVEWPDEHLMYDTLTHTWIATQTSNPD